MDLNLTGRLRATMPALVAGLRKASETSAAPKALLSRVMDAAPTPDVVARLASGGMAGAGSLAPPPLPPVPTTARPARSLAGQAASAARALSADPGVAGDAGKSESLGKLGRALDLLETSVREQQDLIRRGLGDLR